MKNRYDERDANTVKTLSQYGVPQEDIAATIGCCVETMLKRYGKQHREGKAIANAHIGKRLFDKAMDGDTAALIFWAKTRMGWREINRTEVVSPDGSMSPTPPVCIDLSEMTPEDIAKMAKAAFRGQA